jgi:putative SOS response-associated peptidase YedK
MRRFVQAFAAGDGPPGLPPPLLSALQARPDRYNVAGTQTIAILRRARDGTLEVADAAWGLVPTWSKTPGTRYTTVTTRLERAARSRIAGHAWRAQQRCVIPMNGYYKWDRSRRPHRPFFIHAADGAWLLAAGLWECWEKGDAPLLSCSVLTAPNPAIPPPLVADGPRFLGAVVWRRWLDGAGWFPQAFLAGTPQPALSAYPVTRALRDPARDDYTLLEPVAADDTALPAADGFDDVEEDED